MATSAQAGNYPANFTESVVATGLQSPSGMVVAADGRVFIGDQKGRVWVVVNDSMRSTPVLNIQAKVDYNVERGMQGIVLDPDFAVNGFIYAFYTALKPSTHNRLSRFTVVNNLADTAETILLDLPGLPTRGSFACQNVSYCTNTTNAVWHMGGGLIFGNDGKLYLGVGEHEVTSMSQSMTSMFGKVLRLNKDGSIPSDNPFYNTATGDYRAIYATGLRNPYTFGIQRSTGRIYINDVGDVTWEEVDTLTAGGNYGWGTCEGNYATASTSAACSITGQVKPLFAYQHGITLTSRGNCAVGGDFTSNFRAQDNGKYFFADFNNTASTTAQNGWIKSVNPNTGGDTTVFATGYSNITNLRFNPSGSAMYVLTRGYNTGTIDTVGTSNKIGRVYKLTYNLATSIQNSAAYHPVQTIGSLLVLDARSALKVPQFATSVRLVTLSGRVLWETRGLVPGSQFALPSHLTGGVARAVWQ